MKNEDIEIKLLLEAIYLKYGYDFKDYSEAYIQRRIIHRLNKSNFNSISEMQYKVLYDPLFFSTLLQDFSINVTEMFRDPLFFKSIREEVIPILKTYPFIKIWHAGCATGEEVYSMAILLKEEGMLERTQIYATDFNEVVLERAREGIYPVENIKKYIANYQKAGGLYSFSDYYMAKYNSVIMDENFKKRIIFANHNLVEDGVFGEMHMIICRNVLIYFNKKLQNRVIKLFLDSLCNGGFLCLGLKEDLKFTKYEQYFQILIGKDRIFKKKLQI